MCTLRGLPQQQKNPKALFRGSSSMYPSSMFPSSQGNISFLQNFLIQTRCDPKHSTIWQLLIRVIICKVTLSSPCFWASFHPYPLFQWYPQSKDIRLNLSMKCWNSAFNAWGPRLTYRSSSCTVRRSENIYTATEETLRKEERQDETQFTTKIDGFLSFISSCMLMYFFVGFFFLWISSCVWPNSGFWCCVFLTLWITLLTSWNSLCWPGLDTI